MGKFEDILRGAVRGFSPDAANAARLGGPVFDGSGALRADFSAEAVAGMLSDSQALSVLAALPEAERARLRAGLASQNRLWAEKFDTIMEDALTAPEGAMPAGQRVLPDVFEGGTPADDIKGLGLDEDLPGDVSEVEGPARFKGLPRAGIGGVDGHGTPKTAPAAKQGDFEAIVADPAEARSRLSRLGGADGATNPGEAALKSLPAYDGRSQRFKDPDTGKSRVGQTMGSGQETARDSQHRLVSRASGSDPSAPTRMVSDEAVGDLSDHVSVPRAGKSLFSSANSRAADAVKALNHTFRDQAPSIMRALTAADDTNAAEFAYALAEAVTRRMFTSTERLSPRTARDAVHGYAAAILAASGRKIDVLPDSIMDADIAAINASKPIVPRVSEQLSGMTEADFVSRAVALGESPEVARRAFRQGSSVLDRPGAIPPRADAPEPGPIDIDAHRTEVHEFDPDIENVIAEFVRLGHMPDRPEKYRMQRYFPTEPGPGTTFPPAAQKAGPEASPDWKPDPLTGEPAPITGAASAGTPGAPAQGKPLPPIPAKGAKPYAEQVKEYEKALKKYEKEQKAFEAGKRTIKPTKPRKPFNPSGPESSPLPEGSPDEMPAVVEAAPAAADDGLAAVPEVIPAPAKPGRKPAAKTPAPAESAAAEETFGGMPKSAWRDRFVGSGGRREADAVSAGVSMTPAQFDQWWEGQRASGRVKGEAPAKQGEPFVLGADAADEVSATVVTPNDAPADGLPVGAADELAPVPATVPPPKGGRRRRPAAATPAQATPTPAPAAATPAPAAATPAPAAATPAPAGPSPAGPTPAGAAAARARAAAQRAAQAAAGPTPTPGYVPPWQRQPVNPNGAQQPHPQWNPNQAGPTPSPSPSPTPTPTPTNAPKPPRGIVLGTADRIGEAARGTYDYFKARPYDIPLAGAAAAGLGYLFSGMFGEREDPMADIKPAFLPAGGTTRSVGPQPERVDPADIANPGAPTPQTIREYMHYKQRMGAKRRRFTGQQGYANNSMWESLYDD
jgi:hypothetical protein